MLFVSVEFCRKTFKTTIELFFVLMYVNMVKKIRTHGENTNLEIKATREKVIRNEH